MSKRTRQMWTDEELGYVGGTMDLPRAEVAAHIGRSVTSVADMRKVIRSGWTRKSEWWSPEEDALILASTNLSSKQLAARLPGRSVRAVEHQRAKIQETRRSSHQSNPYAVGTRTLLAKTCTQCGLLLPGKWFGANTGRDGVKRRNSECRDCNNGRERERHGVRVHHYKARAQAITLPGAEMHGEPWTEADYKVLSDPNSTILEKALKTRRTYFAAQGEINKSGYTSLKPKGDPKHEQWLIDNPNADRIEEITAMLNQPEPTNPIRPDFEWDD